MEKDEKVISTERRGLGRSKKGSNGRKGNVAYLIPARLIGFRAVIKADKREREEGTATKSSFGN